MRGIFTEKSDVFSYGLVLGEIWGQHPFEKYQTFESNAAVMSVLEKNSLQPKFPTNCPPEIISIVSDCIQWEPSKRPSFREIFDRLKKIQRNEHSQNIHFNINSHK